MNLEGLKHWKSTMLGVVMIVIALATAGKALLDNDPATNLDPTQLSIDITAGLALIKAQFPASTKPATPIVTPLLILALALSCIATHGCATCKFTFVDGTDGSAVTFKDSVPWGMKRDLSQAKATYDWTGKGAGAWKIGGETKATDGTLTIPLMLESVNAFKSLLDLLGEKTAKAATPIPIGPTLPITP